MQGDYKRAYTHLSNYMQTNDSLSTILKSNKFLYYQSQFETERKDNEIFKKNSEIELLQKDQEIASTKQKFLWLLIVSIFVIASGITYIIWRTGKRKQDGRANPLAVTQKSQDCPD